LIPEGDELLLEPFGETPPRVGEIAAYINPDGLEVVHRLCHRDTDGWWGNADTVLAMERTGSLIGRVTARRWKGSVRAVRPMPARAGLAWLIHRLYRHSHGLLGAWGRVVLQLVQRLKPLLYHTRQGI